jgi:hypothetical protein
LMSDGVGVMVHMIAFVIVIRTSEDRFGGHPLFGADNGEKHQEPMSGWILVVYTVAENDVDGWLVVNASGSYGPCENG